MKANEKYIGIDANLEESLFDYGLLVEDTTNTNKWIIMMLNDNLFMKRSFDFSGLSELLEESYIKDSLNSFFDFSGLTLKEFFEEEPVNQLYDLISYFGTDNILGGFYGSKEFSKTEICEYLGFDYIED